MQQPDPSVAILERFRTLLVVGCSATPGKDAHEVPRFLERHGYEVVPVNPNHAEVLGHASYPTVLDVPWEVRERGVAVVVFRPSREAPDVARQAAEAGAKALWLQLGIRHPEARRIAEQAGMLYVEDACTKVELARVRRRAPR